MRCVSQSKLLGELRNNRAWKTVTNPAQDRLCHGDLVLEDILVDWKDPKKFKLLDPNPINQSIYFDLGKTLLSLWVGYEFIYYDLFSINEFLIESDGGIRIRIGLGRPDCQKIYEEAANMFMKFVQEQLIGLLGIQSEELESRLRMTAALQALAIPMFHLLHHKREMKGNCICFIRAI